MLMNLVFGFYWYILLTILGVMVLPLSMKLFRRMPEHGILLARPLGWLLVATTAWWLAFIGIWPFTSWGILVVALLYFAGSSYLVYRNPQWFRKRFKHHWRTALNGEIITIVVFFLILLVRMIDHNIDSTEKPMDAMFLSALTSTWWMPPQDPWFAGFSVNYHYGGYLLHAVIMQLGGISVEYGYNLAIAGVAAVAASIAFVLGRALFGRCRYAVVTVIGTLFVGNLASVINIVNLGTLSPNLSELRWSYLWSTSRVIVDNGGDTINEYPFFSIVWGDVHPHFTNLAFFLFFMAICYVILKGLWRLRPFKMLKYEWHLFVVAIVACGFLLPTNIFDFPILSLFYGFVILTVILHYWQRKIISLKMLGCLVLLGALPLLGYLFASPFWLYFESPLTGPKIKLVPFRTDLIEFILVFGAHAVLSLLILATQTQNLIQHRSVEEKGFIAALAGIVLIIFWSFTGSIIFAFSCVMMLAFWGLVIGFLLRPFGDKNSQMNLVFAGVSCALAWSIIWGCEVVYIPDNYGIARMNTLFKFHYAAWLLFGVGLPYLMYRFFKLCSCSNIKPALTAVLVLVFAFSVMGPGYTLTAMICSKRGNSPMTLNGLQYMEASRPDHYKLIQWVRENIEPHSRIAEIPGSAYSQESLISAFTGRATVIGWENHEHVWRPNDELVTERENDTYYFFTTQNEDDIQEYINKYQVDYVVFAEPPAGTNRAAQVVAQMKVGVWQNVLEPVYVQGGDRWATASPYAVFKVPESMKVKDAS